MKILALADFHGHRPSFKRALDKALEEKVDLIVLAGDITHFGNLKTARELLDILKPSKATILYVPGNCDPPSLAYVEWEDIICLHGRKFKIEDLVFMGVGGALTSPFYTLFEMREEGIRNVLDRSLNQEENAKFILVSHVPPKNTKVDLAYLGTHIGSLSVRRFIEEKHPLCVICGHVHEALGIDKINETVIVNPGPARMMLCAIIRIEKEIDVVPGFL